MSTLIEAPSSPTAARIRLATPTPRTAEPLSRGPQVDGTKAQEEIRHQPAHPADALGEMVGGLAHDFRNVLAVISSALNLADRDGADPEKVSIYLSAARNSIDQGSRLIARLLTLARPSGPDTRPVKASALISELAPFLEYAAGPGVKLALELQEDAHSLLVDRGRFRAALLNLVFNARDAMQEGGKIRICVHSSPEDPKWVRVSVTDTGDGMAEETISHIFEPWFTTKEEAGTGLGLPQVQTLMRDVGGTVQVISKPGQGTTFALLFPSAAPADQSQAFAGTSRSRGRERKISTRSDQ